MAGSVRPGLRSPITALDFLLLGPALLLLEAHSRLARWWMHLLSCGAAVASVFGVLDFALDPGTPHSPDWVRLNTAENDNPKSKMAVTGEI